MLGFTQNDVAGMLDYYKQHKNIPYPAANLMDIMNTWYNNYCFAGRAETRLFNSDMVLYFIGKCVRTEHIPDELIDHNVRIDYRKLRHLVMIDSEKGKLPNGNFDRLKQIIEKGTIRTNKIVDSFPVEQLTDTQNFISLLFYFGLLTIKGLEYEQPVLQIPNETVKQLYFDYIQSVYRETGIFSIDLYEYEELMLEMAYKGNWKPLFKYLAGHMTESMSLRDLITGEKSIQAFLNVYLALTRLYIVHCEKEFNQGYADIFMRPFTTHYKAIKYAYMIEVKYIKKGDKTKSRKSLIKQAEEQLKSYSLDQKLKNSLPGVTLIKLVLVFTGNELTYFESV